MYIRKRLLVVGLVLFLATIACNIASGQGQSDESEAAWTEFQACVENERALRASTIYDEPDQYQDCFPDLSIDQLEALREHDNCLINPDCLIAIESHLDLKDLVEEPETVDEQATQDAKCAGLTKEECANDGTHFYNIVRYPGPSTADCRYQDWPPSKEPREILFEDNKILFRHLLENEGYTGHARVAQNVFEWTNPANGDIYTTTFTANGFSEDVTANVGDCNWHIEHTFVE